MSTSGKSGRQVERPFAGTRKSGGQSFTPKTDGRRSSSGNRRGRGFWDVLG